MSLIIWMFALLPQMVQSYQTKSVESQSIGFWILWVIADATNLVGCFLTNQIITNTLLAVFYSISSVIILFQWFYYTYWYTAKKAFDMNSSVKTVAKTTGALGGALCCVTLAQDSVFSSSLLSVDGRRRLLHLTPRGRTILGATLGWLMAFIYIISRAPQLWKSVTTKEVQDLSRNMFICTFLGNLTQMLSMVIKHVQELDMEYFKRNSPWMINAGLCAVQDLILVYLITRYGNRKREQSHELQPLLSPLKQVRPAGSSYQAITPIPKQSDPEGRSYSEV